MCFQTCVSFHTNKVATRKWDIKLEHTDLDASTSHLAVVDVEDEPTSEHKSASANGTICGSNILVPTSFNMDGDDIFEDTYDDA